MICVLFYVVFNLVGFSLDLVFRIEKDIRVTTEAALGLIGGTMGLFTGHTIMTLAASHLDVDKYPCIYMCG